MAMGFTPLIPFATFEAGNIAETEASPLLDSRVAACFAWVATKSQRRLFEVVARHLRQSANIRNQDEVYQAISSRRT